ncbi:ATP-dependent DNA ligase [Pacificimonas flava]|uniref:DNA ligase (ATP) n=2 Tax=Pacificimonas TaxID=1960290 RepID=A0A219B5M8_9SPHN|nr:MULTISPECIES: cisplatin damage response ATP-dependent DNA ligase [Pacificimonas]MBZ6379309.1 cisplatin damage response ATP-dependent DNA ligase [Pacificimonas aurantium]OWV33484.1 ATP-dependent DNA ligase [Pacificimonas flava]
MKAFAELLERLVYTRSRNAKLKLIADYLRATPDPDRGWALATLTEELDFKSVKPGLIKALVEGRVDPVLFRMSRNYVGDMAETVSLIWEPPPGVDPEHEDLRLADVVERLQGLSRTDAPGVMTAYLDLLTPTERFALIKLATGALRIGVSARLAKTAFAQAFDVDLDDVEEVWHGIDAPYPALFAWGEGSQPRPTQDDVPVFRPFMLAHPLEDGRVDPEDYAAEWKWDGVRVQLVHVAGQTKLFSRTGDDVTAAFPDVAEAFREPGALDGELMVRGDVQGGEAGGAASFNALQQRLGRKTVSKKMLAEAPAFVRAYDILFDGPEDLRALPWTERRARLEAFARRLPEDRFDLSQTVEAEDFDHLAGIREGARSAAIEGLMLKRKDSAYVPGRKTGLWYKWKRDPLLADCVVMYAQRGSGRRSSYFSDYTFGCWTGPEDDPERRLLPVGKAYSGITDEELKQLDKFVRANTIDRFGPVREVEKSLVLEIAFDSIHASRRHKSGIAMRFPRINRIRTDKPAEEADEIVTLEKMIS